MDEILEVVKELDDKLKYLYYLCEKNNIKVSVDLDTIHYSLHSRIVPTVENLKKKEENKNVI